tara:strand:+ start:285 stop:2903 length:2619 start_codon:yes stop_codon:yes gene_type:complete
MAINFLQDVSLNNTQLTNFKVQNLTGTLPSSLAGEGQLIYKTDTNELYLHKGSNSWEELSTGGSVTSVGVSSNYLTIGSSPITSSGVISVNVPNSGVTAASYTHASITVNAQGIVTAASNGTATLGVTAFSNANGTFVSAGTANSGATGAVTMGTIDLSAGGTPSSSTFLRGDNVWASVPGGYTSWTLQGDSGSNLSVTDGTTVDLAGGTGISTATTATGMTLTNTGVTSAVAGSNISVSNATGAVTIAYTGGTGSMNSWNLAGDSGSQSIVNGNTATFIGGTGLTTAASASDDLTITLDDTAVSPGTYTLATITVDQQGRLTSASSGSSGAMTTWKIGSTSGTDQTVSDGQTVDVVGGTYITGSVGGTRTVTLAHDTTSRTNNTSSTSPGSAGTFTAIDTITTNTTGHVTAVNTKTVTMPTVPSSDNYQYWTLQGDSGTNLNVTSTSVADIAGGDGISTATTATGMTLTNDGVIEAAASTGISVSSATGSVTFTNTGVTSVAGGTGISVSASTGGVTITNTSTNTDANYALSVGAVSSNESTLSLVGSSGGSTTTAKFSGTTNEIQITTPGTGNGGDITIGLPNDVTISSDLTVGDNLTMTGGNLSVTGTGSFTGQVTVPTTPSASTDAASKNYVDTSISGSGALIYQGGYNASTNTPNLTSTGQGILKGFTYAVTAAGNASGFWSPTLEIGDLVIANQDNPASAADWTEINKNIDVATATVQGIANFPTAGGLSVSNGAVSMATQTSNGTYGGVTKSLSTTIDTKGRVTAMSENTIAIPASQITDFCAAVTTCIGNNHNYAVDIGDDSATTYVVTHNLGTRDVMVQCYYTASPYGTVELQVERNSTSQVTLSTVDALANDSVRVLVTEIL